MPQVIEVYRARIRKWLEKYNHGETKRKAENLHLRRDFVTLLNYVGENKVVGTQSTGNLPLKDVREVTAQFVVPPTLDPEFHGYTVKTRSEFDVWPLYFLHILAEVSELVAIAPGRRWRLTPQGEDFLALKPLQQTAILLSIWWYRVNWIVAFPYQGIGEQLPLSFNFVTLEELLTQSTVASVNFEEFANRIIQKTGLHWIAEDMTYARTSLHAAIDRMVIQILVNFDMVECVFREDHPQKLDAFRITPFGNILLENLNIIRESN